MKKRFTLVEIFAVVAIIAILSIIGVAGYSYAQNASRESDTKAVEARLVAALETVKNKGGSIPVAKDNFTKFTIENIATDNPKVSAGSTMVSKDAKNFLSAIEVDSLGKHLKSNELVDAWGNPIYYRYPGKFNVGGIDLVSAGADGKFGADNAGEPPTDISKYKDGKELICDDVVNF